MGLRMPIKPLRFLGDSLERLREWSPTLKRKAGGELYRVQSGDEPESWKPMKTVGAGVREIRIKDEYGIARIFYVTKVVDAVYVLHCFEKKTEKTDRRDLEIGKQRYKGLMEGR
jgi:phage-related protein